MLVVCFDLEGVLMPEVWINVAEKTGIDELRRTTRDEPDYDKLMRYRLDILDEHGIMNFSTLAVGDSYNDTNMLAEAHSGILFRPPQNVIDEFPQFPVVEDYTALMAEIKSAAANLGE